MKKTQNIVNYSGIGEVRYSRNPRARNLSIRINQQGEVRVTLPRMISWSRGEAFFFVPAAMGLEKAGRDE